MIYRTRKAALTAAVLLTNIDGKQRFVVKMVFPTGATVCTYC